jgi:hypothetical protein
LKPISRRQLIAGATAAAAIAITHEVWSQTSQAIANATTESTGQIVLGAKTFSLTGVWRFQRGGPSTETSPGSLPILNFNTTINLPGTTDTNKIGPASSEKDDDSLTQPYRFVGPCWYETDIDIPAAWEGKRVSLFLERTRYSQVWLDGTPIGDNPLLCTPQEYFLGDTLSMGTHKLTIAVDNSRVPVNADAHMWSDNTQGNWNGILGKIELLATDSVWIDDLQIYSMVAEHSILVKLRLGSQSGTPGAGSIMLRPRGAGIPTGTVHSVPVQWSGSSTDIETRVELGPSAALWDEFHPSAHTLIAHLTAPGIDYVRTATFGLREFNVAGKHFAINGHPAFLRGKHDACVFPLTGFAPMDSDAWMTYFRILRSYGLNHVRFHTWTPPEAAFEAADIVGFYLQPELPFWGTWTEDIRSAMEPEAKAILTRLGNHPSFVMFSMGNEPWGGQSIIGELLTDLHQLDNRRLFVHGTGDQHPVPQDDYTIAGDVSLDWGHPLKSVRGSNAGSPFDKGHAGHIQMGPPNTLTDYVSAISPMPNPVVTHEMGQYTVYPDFDQLTKYTGTNIPYNLERFQKILSDAGMTDQAIDFARATGQLAAICYREEIESCLRTPDHGGFELLDLVDYPGQGTALVGMLDAFMDSKGILEPDEWRLFCSPTVLLAKFERYVWTSDEPFHASIGISHFGDNDLTNTEVQWRLLDADNNAIETGVVSTTANPAARELSAFAPLAFSLQKVKTPTKLTLDLSQPTSDVRNDYPIWVYPAAVDTSAPSNVVIAQSFDSKTSEQLAAGGTVVLICDCTKPLAQTVGGAFASDFWNFRFFFNKPGTMGLLTDPNHPALAAFPTEFHSNWQWFQTTLYGQPLILDGIVPSEYKPIVQVIDNYERCHKLGLIFEAKVGTGKLLVCASDLIALSATDIAAKQLLASLLSYASSDHFEPTTTIDVDQIRSLLRTSIPTTACIATASSTGNDWRGVSASQLIDGNEARGWQAGQSAGSSCWCQVQFPSPVDIGALEILWDEDAPGYQYIVKSSTDGSSWETVSDQSHNTFSSARQELLLNVNSVSYIQVDILSVPYDRPPKIMEIRFFSLVDGVVV